MHGNFKEYQLKMKSMFDNKDMNRDFQEGDLVLLLDKRHDDPSKNGKLDNLWLCPYVINKKCRNISNTLHL